MQDDATWNNLKQQCHVMNTTEKKVQMEELRVAARIKMQWQTVCHPKLLWGEAALKNPVYLQQFIQTIYQENLTKYGKVAWSSILGYTFIYGSHCWMQSWPSRLPTLNPSLSNSKMDIPQMLCKLFPTPFGDGIRIFLPDLALAFVGLKTKTVCRMLLSHHWCDPDEVSGVGPLQSASCMGLQLVTAQWQWGKGKEENK